MCIRDRNAKGSLCVRLGWRSGAARGMHCRGAGDVYKRQVLVPGHDVYHFMCQCCATSGHCWSRVFCFADYDNKGVSFCCFLCPSKVVFFAPLFFIRVVLINVANAHVIWQLIVEKLTVYNSVITFERFVGSHCSLHAHHAFDIFGPRKQ